MGLPYPSISTVPAECLEAGPPGTHLPGRASQQRPPVGVGVLLRWRGESDYLPKPFAPDQVRHAAQHALEGGASSGSRPSRRTSQVVLDVSERPPRSLVRQAEPRLTLRPEIRPRPCCEPPGSRQDTYYPWSVPIS